LKQFSSGVLSLSATHFTSTCRAV